MRGSRRIFWRNTGLGRSPGDTVIIDKFVIQLLKRLFHKHARRKFPEGEICVETETKNGEGIYKTTSEHISEKKSYFLNESLKEYLEEQKNPSQVFVVFLKTSLEMPRNVFWSNFCRNFKENPWINFWSISGNNYERIKNFFRIY